MSASIVWLDTAAADLDRILNYLEERNPKAALSVARAIRRDTDDLLSDYPHAGRVGRRKGTREKVIAATPFILVYRVKAKARRVEVLRVLHGAQQWPISGESV